MKKIFSFFIVLLLTTNFIFSQDSESDDSDLSYHSLDELKSFEGIYGSDEFPLKFKLYEKENKLVMSWVGRSEEEAMVLDEDEKNKFSMPMAGLELDFRVDETRFETKTVSSKGTNIKIQKTILRKMIFKISGNEIAFTMLPPQDTSDQEE